MPDKKQYTLHDLGFMLEFIQEKVENIEQQAIRTNGRIKSLEMWRMFLLGAWAVITILVPVLYMQVTARVDAFTTSIDYKITSAIQQNNDKYFER